MTQYISDLRPESMHSVMEGGHCVRFVRRVGLQKQQRRMPPNRQRTDSKDKRRQRNRCCTDAPVFDSSMIVQVEAVQAK